MPPTLFAVAPGGPFMLMPESLEDGAAKDDFATTARLMCIAHAATACVMALEAWVKFGKPNEKVDLTELPSEAFDRKEVIVLMGESRDVQKQKFLLAEGDRTDFKNHIPPCFIDRQVKTSLPQSRMQSR
jgi:hypothetical protein